MTNVFEVRDGTDTLIRDGGYKMSPTAHALLWYLLYNGIYDRGSEWFGHVNIYKTSSTVLASATGRTATSVRHGLQELGKTGFIRLTPRVREDGSNTNPDIELTVPKDFCFACRTRGHADGVCQVPPEKLIGPR